MKAYFPSTGDANVTCTVGEDDVFQSAETIVSFPSHILRPEVAGNETVEEVEEDTGTAVWRPPTPPKVSPQSQVKEFFYRFDKDMTSTLVNKFSIN